MNNPIFIIIKKEVTDILRDYRLSIPVISFALVFPTLVLIGFKFIIPFLNPKDPIYVLENLFSISVLIVTFFPSALTVVIALESFVGEKERQTLENLLLAPISDKQIYFGKLIASIISPLSLGYMSFLLYFIQSKIYIHYFTPLSISILILLLVFIKTLLLVSGAVVLSIHAKTVRSANLNATLIVFPTTFLIGLESHLLMYNKISTLWFIFFELVIYCLIFLKVGLKLFNRENIFLSDTSIFTFSDMLSVFKTKFLKTFFGEAPTFKKFFLQDIPFLIYKNRRKVLLATIFLISGFILSFYYTLYIIGEKKYNFCNEIIRMKDYDISDDFSSTKIAKHNIRAVAIVTVLSLFTFGASALIFIFLPGAMIGGLTAIYTDGSFYCILHYLKFLLPHSIFEFPAAILTCVFIFNLGTFIFRVDKENKPLDEFIKSLAELTKILIIVIPLFILASILEVHR